MDSSGTEENLIHLEVAGDASTENKSETLPSAFDNLSIATEATSQDSVNTSASSNNSDALSALDSDLTTGLATNTSEISSVIVSIDAWQNQRYRPLQGWNSNFNNASGAGSASGSAGVSGAAAASAGAGSGGGFHFGMGGGGGAGGTPSEFAFSDITGEFCIACVEVAADLNASVSGNNNNKNGGNYTPYAALPKGWQWASDWKIDFSETYGNKDPQGWSYANNFESLYKASMGRSLSGQQQRLSLARRRRWTRRRVCVDADARASFLSEKRFSDVICGNITDIIANIDTDWMFLTDFNKVRAARVTEGHHEIEIELQNSVVALEHVLEKLTLSRTYLKDRAQLEMAYARQLEAFSEKWINAGKTTAPPPTAGKSNSNTNMKKPPSYEQLTSSSAEFANAQGQDKKAVEDSTAEAPSEEEEDSSKNEGFFSLICTASNSVARRLGEFSTLMSTTLFFNVDSLISEVSSVLTDSIKGEAPLLRRKLKQSMLATDLRYSLLERVSRQARAFLFAQRHSTSHLLVNKSAAFEVENGSDTGRSASVDCDTLSLPSQFSLLDLIRSPWAYLINDFFSSDSKSSESGNNSSGNSFYTNLPGGGFDSWLVLQMFRQNVLETEGNLSVFQSFVKQQTKFTSELMVRVSTMLQETVLTFASEQSRAFDDAKLILQEICESINPTAHRPDADIVYKVDNRQHHELWKDFGGDSDCESDISGIGRRLRNDSSCSIDGFPVPTTTIQAEAHHSETEVIPEESTIEEAYESEPVDIEEDAAQTQEEDDSSWRVVQLDRLHMSRYLVKATKVRFAILPRLGGGRRQSVTSSPAPAANFKISLSPLYISNTPSNAGAAGANGPQRVATDYEVPKWNDVQSDAFDASSTAALNSLSHLTSSAGRGGSWFSGVLLVTSDAAVHLFCDSSEFGSTSIYSLVSSLTRGASGNDASPWTTHSPVISSEVIHLRAEPSPVLFPGAVGDAFVLRFARRSEEGGATQATSADPNGNFGYDAIHGRFMTSFIRDGGALGVVVDGSAEVKDWLRVLRNPYFDTSNTF